jgi:hypothetical protein
MLEIDNSSFLSKAEIKERASSVFTTVKGEATSEKYTHIPTDQVIDDMEKLGWGVVDAKQVRARKGVGYQKHLVVFRNPNVAINGEDGDDVFPQILLTNSHDGKNAFTFTAGLFRMVCENGLVISTQEFENLKIRHMGYSFTELQATITSMVEKLPLTVDSMNKLKATKLNQEQKIDFAKRALETRFSKEEVANVTIDINELLEPTRKEDSGDDIWSVFNVIQEKLIHGMFEYKTGAKARKARKIKNFNQDLKVNEKLFELALEYVAA